MSQGGPWGGMLPPIILHADLDCFYCQVERIRLDLPEDQPMAVQQWANVIAVNYPARGQGVTRHKSAAECLAKCPSMVFVHVPTYSISKPGQLFYHGAKGATPEEPVPLSPPVWEHKSSLSVYRKASLLIFQVFGRYADVLEKAGLDEAFMDISKRIDIAFFVEFGVQAGEAAEWEGLRGAWEDVNWEGLGVPAIPNEVDSPPPSAMVNDLRIWLAAKIAKEIRLALREELGYTCSIGIANNKMLAKLGSARNKPFNQTFILHSMVEPMMRGVPLKKIRFLGGKLGLMLTGSQKGNRGGGEEEEDGDFPSEDEEAHAEEQDTLASDLWPLTVSELSYKLGGDMEAARWVHAIIRGVDPSPVTPRSKPKSFMAAKSLRPALKDWSQVDKWLRLLSLELWERLEEDSQTNKRWPKTVTLYFKTFSMEEGKGQSTEFPIFSPDLFSIDILVTFLVKMLHQTPHSIFPMNRLTISVSRFVPLEDQADGKKWSRLEKFFNGPKRPVDFDSIPRSEAVEPSVHVTKKPKGPLLQFFKGAKQTESPPSTTDEDSWACPDCPTVISIWEFDQIQEHQDYHFASKLKT